MHIHKSHTCQYLGGGREDTKQGPPPRNKIMDTRLYHLLETLEYLDIIGLEISLYINRFNKLTISRISGLLLCTIVYSNGLKKSFWNLK